MWRRLAATVAMPRRASPIAYRHNARITPWIMHAKFSSGVNPSGNDDQAPPLSSLEGDLDDDDDEDDDMVDMVDIGPMGREYGGPTRGGKFKEPTRFGDWERQGRCTDF